jgi:hypothetical protein
MMVDDDVCRGNKQDLKKCIKMWMLDTRAFRVLDVSDPQFHFCISLRFLQNKNMPLIHVANLKQLVNGKDSIIVMWEWDTKFGNSNVQNVINDPNLRKNFLIELDEQVDPGDNRFRFFPSRDDFNRIRFQHIFPIELANRLHLKNETLDALQLFVRVTHIFDLAGSI